MIPELSAWHNSEPIFGYIELYAWNFYILLDTLTKITSSDSYINNLRFLGL